MKLHWNYFQRVIERICLSELLYKLQIIQTFNLLILEDPVGPMTYMASIYLKYKSLRTVIIS